MAITDDAQRELKAMRIVVGVEVDAAIAALAQAWGRAWDELTDEWTAAVADLLEVGDGQWPSHRQIARAERAQAALKATRAAIERMVAETGLHTTGSLRRIVDLAGEWEQRIAAVQLPPGMGSSIWTRVDADALGAIITRTTGQIEALTAKLPTQQAAVMRQTLIRGVLVGDSPHTAARLMMRRLGGVFDGGRRRAEVIARTEMIDASRASALASRKANADVLKGWMWSCTKSVRSCGACLAMDGKVFAVDEPGPHGHQQCRCSASPVTKTWRDLGFDIDEPPSTYQSGRDWFDQQPEATQLRILGPTRLKALRDGDIDWDDIPTVKSTPGWRDSVIVAPLPA